MSTVEAPAATAGREQSGSEERTRILVRDGIPGFPGLHDWELLVDAEIDPLMWFAAADGGDTRLLVLDPRHVEPSYAPKFGPPALEAVGAAPDDPLVVLGVVNVEPDGSATINLRAPLLICPRTMRGAQVILDRSDLSMRHPIEVGG
ncbi:MAG: flagellar assembly protein FliW [Acidobacteriota bacterium]|nr:MAG: flagellar assembly protein FliW [Acidobacteriota bacterium]